MVLIRLLVAEGIFRNVRVFAKHVGTKDNGKAEALSRLDFKRFWHLVDSMEFKMNQQVSSIPTDLWPMSKLWLY